jgi:hypothetical protein
MLSQHPWTRLVLLSGLVFLATLLLFSAPSPLSVPVAHAATCSVTTDADSGEGSLRQKVGDAACDTITFDAALFGVGRTITLSTQIDIGRNLTIDGSGVVTPTISGKGATRVFSITSASNVTLHHLKIYRGDAGEGHGGGIYNSGALTVSNSILSSNWAWSQDGGAIYNTGVLSVTNSTFSGNGAYAVGGAIYNGGILVVTGCTISGNTGMGGGGIYNTGALTVTSTIFTGNGAYGYGGGVVNDGTLVATNSTFISNTVSAYSGYGGGLVNGGALTVTSSAFTGNSSGTGGGGAVYNRHLHRLQWHVLRKHRGRRPQLRQRHLQLWHADAHEQHGRGQLGNGGRGHLQPGDAAGAERHHCGQRRYGVSPWRRHRQRG